MPRTGSFPEKTWEKKLRAGSRIVEVLDASTRHVEEQKREQWGKAVSLAVCGNELGNGMLPEIYYTVLFHSIRYHASPFFYYGINFISICRISFGF
jgi:hypothetical protein